MTAYFNEKDKDAANWLRELIRAGLIADGVVDERSIEDVHPRDLDGFTQCHFFAGIGVWSYALRCAGWPDDRPVWTGSCPCQPFSAAGKGAGFADERHLWPAWHHLIRERRPVVVFGEQVASKDGLGWFDLVHADLEAADYAVGAVDLCAAGLGAPHIRQRMYFVGHTNREHEDAERGVCRRPRPESRGGVSLVADDDDAGQLGVESLRLQGPGVHDADGRGPVNGFWSGADWIPCRDGKWRPTQPGIFPLVDGSAARVVRSSNPGAPIEVNASAEGRVMRLRGYGNAIVAPVAEAFIRSYCEAVTA